MEKAISLPQSWKHPYIWQQFSCDGKLPFDDYVLFYL